MAEPRQIELANVDKCISTTSPKELIAFSNHLKTIIAENNLFTLIGKGAKQKAYVNVEGWQIAGAFCGMYPIVKWTKDLSKDYPTRDGILAREIKYQAKVVIYKDDENGVPKKQAVGYATCSNKENGKKYFDEYAIESMAQTRAIGKAYRTSLGYLLKMAGYEATPLEEMEPIVAKEAQAQSQQQPQPKAQVDMSDLYGGKNPQPQQQPQQPIDTKAYVVQ